MTLVSFKYFWWDELNGFHFISGTVHAKTEGNSETENACSGLVRGHAEDYEGEEFKARSEQRKVHRFEELKVTSCRLTLHY